MDVITFHENPCIDIYSYSCLNPLSSVRKSIFKSMSAKSSITKKLLEFFDNLPKLMLVIGLASKFSRVQRGGEGQGVGSRVS